MTTYIVVDLECTCTDKNEFPRNQMEIIEIGAVAVNGNTLKIVNEYSEFVRPVRNPKLTEFCINLTTIKQEDVDCADNFVEVLPRFKKWVIKHISPQFCSWGYFDKNQLERDCNYHNLDYPFDASHINLKEEFSHKFKLKKRYGVTFALKLCGLHFEGIHHRGIDDVKNIVRLLPYIFGEKKLKT